MSDSRIRVRVNPLLKDLIPRYFEKLNEDFELIENAVTSESFTLVMERAHAIKGHAGMYGFAELSSLAHALELAAKEEDSDKAATEFKSMQDYVKNLDLDYDE